MNYQEAVKDFITHLECLNYAPGTLRNIKKGLNAFGRYLEKQGVRDVLKISRALVLGYLDEVRKSQAAPSAKRAKVREIKRLFDYLQEKRGLFFNPLESVPLPKNKKSLPRDILSMKDAERLIEAPNTGLLTGIRDRAMLELLYSAGIRRQEAVNLKAEDVDLKSGCLMVREGKGKKDRLIPVGKTAGAWLKEYIQKVRPRFRNPRLKEEALFLSPNGEPLSAYWIMTTLKEAARQGKIKKAVTPHTLRHSMATHLLLGGADIITVQRILGHKRPSTTTIYTHVVPVDIKKTHKKTHPREKPGDQ